MFEKIVLFSVLFAFQFGGPSLLSVSGVACVLLIYLMRNGLVDVGNDLVVICIAIFIVPALRFLFDEDFLQIVGRQIRMLMCLLLIISASKIKINLYIFNRLKGTIVFFQAMCFFWCIIQYFALRNGLGLYVFLPYDLYGITAGFEDGSERRYTTIPSYWLIFGMEKGLSFGVEYNLRPTASYTEPSYLGFIMIFCAVLLFIANKFKFNQETVTSIFLALMTAAISESASAVLGVAVIFGFFVFSSRVDFLLRVLIIVFAVSGFLFLGIDDRIFSIGGLSGDVSGFIRFIKPLSNIAQVFSDGYIFGYPQSRAPDYYSPYVGSEYIGSGLDNGIFNIIMDMGILSFVLFFIFYKLLPNYILLIYFVFMMINGNYLGFDRAVVLSIIIVAYNSFVVGGRK